MITPFLLRIALVRAGEVGKKEDAHGTVEHEGEHEHEGGEQGSEALLSAPSDSGTPESSED